MIKLLTPAVVLNERDKERRLQAMKINPSNLSPTDSYHLLVSVVLPRPIAWVSTVDRHGIFNLAPFSAFCIVSVEPAMVGFSVGTRRDGQKKDTLRNIETTKEFVINVVEESLAKAMNITSAPYPSDVSEMEEAGLTPVKADLVKAPLLAESPINMECRLKQVLKFGETATTDSFIIGELLLIHVRDELYANGEVQVSKLKAIGRLGGNMYCRIQDMFEMKRLTTE